MVVEADESDGSFLKLPHEINIITNIDLEHLDYYKTKQKLISSFETFLNNIPFYGYSIVCNEDKNVRDLTKKINTRKVITYSYSFTNSDVFISNIKSKNFKTFFKIIIRKNLINNFAGKYNFEINLLGKHNVLNATGAIISALLVGASIKDINYALKNFKGVKRRFTYIGKINKSLIYDDYAHHPTEIKASYEIAKQISKNKIIVVFQPHRFSRTKELYKDFIKILKKIDILYILDIYSAGEDPIKNINSKKIVQDLSKKHKSVYYIKNDQNLRKILSPFFDNKNLIVFMGAGSVTHKAYKLISDNNEKENSRNF
tara:strand:- start:767 stop:1711 length:945 start_codon:yes stop_codon:yes gene_type:complete